MIGVPETTHFEPLVRKEISEIKFHKLSALTGKGKLKEPKHIMIEPSINDLKKWLKTVARHLRRGFWDHFFSLVSALYHTTHAV